MSKFDKPNRTHSFNFSDVTGKKPSTKKSSSDNFWFWMWFRSLFFRPTKTKTKVVVIDNSGKEVEVKEKPSKTKTFFKWFGLGAVATIIIGTIVLICNADA